PLPDLRPGNAVPARSDRSRGSANPARLSRLAPVHALADEAGGKPDTGRTPELADRFDPQQRIATIHENAGISGESRRIAADVRDALDARVRELVYVLFLDGAR